MKSCLLHCRVATSFLALLLCSFASLRAAEQHGFRVPEGFEVSLFADDDLAHDIFSMTTDSRGRIVVAGAGYVKTLVDTNNDGRADKAIVFSNLPKSGAHGLYFDGNDLICTGDNGLWRFTDKDGDAQADGEPQLLLGNLRHDGHAANGVVRGPDGWYYVSCGNDAGVGAEHARLPGSPVKRVVCGAIVRVSPDGKSSDVYAHGFRNPYDIDFNAYGNLFTMDADGERDQYLPWYAPNRLFDIAQGMEHGWILRGWTHAWNRPESNFDNVERMVKIGRGSPTGVLVYRHRQFPQQFYNGLFSLCWTYGRVYYFPMQRQGSSFQGTMQIFMETVGDTGFAPVDMTVNPKGELFIAIGGRGTRGGVFRVSYNGAMWPNPAGEDRVSKVLAADQPLSSWSRAEWVPQAKQLGRGAFEGAVIDRKLTVAERVRAVEILVEIFGGINPELVRMIAATEEPTVTARAAWALSRGADSFASRQMLASLTYQDDEQITRAAWESLATLPRPLETTLKPAPNWPGGFASEDRRVRAATVLAGSGPGRGSLEQIVEASKPLHVPRHRLSYLFVTGPIQQNVPGWHWGYVADAVDVYFANRDPLFRIDAIRALQIGLGDIQLSQDKPTAFDGYTGAWVDKLDNSTKRYLLDKFSPAFPTAVPELNRELARLLAMLSADDPAMLTRLGTLWTYESTVEDDFHYLICAARMTARRPPEFTAASASALARLHDKLKVERHEPDRFWPERLGQIFERLLNYDPALGAALIAHRVFGLPEHSLFIKYLPETERAEAARILVARADADEKQNPRAWTPQLIEVLTALPSAEGLPILRKLWERPPLQNTASLVLAKYAQADDRARFVTALGSPQPDVVEQCARALTKLDVATQPAELKAAVSALKRFVPVPNQRATRETLAALLQKRSQQNFPVKDGTDIQATYAPWFDWFTKTHPQEAASLAVTETLDISKWKARWAKLTWQNGDATRGRQIFEERTCHRCHEGSYKLGPDLAGITGRFSVEDLFTAIVDPSRDVPPTYANTVIVTKSGNTHSGVLIYDSPAARLLQTAPDTTLRFLPDDIAEVKTGRVSLMPSGLLDGLSDQALTDIYAYLKAGKKK